MYCYDTTLDGKLLCTNLQAPLWCQIYNVKFTVSNLQCQIYNVKFAMPNLQNLQALEPNRKWMTRSTLLIDNG